MLASKNKKGTNYRNAWVSIPVALVAIIAVLSCLNAVVKRQAKEQPHGRFTSKDILDRTRTLVRFSLLPASATLSTSKQTLRTTSGKVMKLWYVDCCDKNGTSVAYVLWDADSGELRLFWREVSPSQYSFPDITRAQAISRAWLLLRQAGIGVPAERWHLEGPPSLAYGLWHVNMKSSRARAFLIIDEHTGQITCMHFRNQLSK